MVRHTTTYVFSLLLLFGYSPLLAQFVKLTDTLNITPEIQTISQLQASKEVLIKNLQPGENYLVQIVTEDDQSCLPSSKMNVPFQISRETGIQYMLDFQATRSIERIFLSNSCLSNTANNYLVTVQCMTCHKEPIVAPRFADIIQAQSGIDEEFLIKDVFVAGGCYEVDNIAFKGPEIAKGVFSKGEVIGVEDGIILATGDVKSCSGPNAATNTTSQFPSAAHQGDKDLNTLLRQLGSSITSTNDVAVLEFDFTPTSDKVSFQYVFASEEYCDYSNSEYNDVFGFFISGPGLNGPYTDNGINIAKIPGTNQDVSINSINWQNNRPYYNNNTPGFRAFGSCSLGEVLATAVAKRELEYDGFTDVFTATADVIPCETYHIKLAVGDVGDKKFDSAVFLAANSFKLGDPAELATEIPNATFPDSNLVYESCQESFFVFKRTEDSDRSKPQEVPFTISDLSTAVSGVDYSPIPSPVTIPVGKDSIKVPVTIYADDLDEGPESIIFELESACTCEGLLTELVIAEPEEPAVNFEDLSTCPGGMVNITPNIEGGIGEFSYEWSTDETSAIISAEINEPTTYFVTVTDECGATSIGEVTVGVEEQSAKLTGDVVICNGEATGEIEVNFTGSAPYSLEYEFNGDTRNISNIETSTYILPEVNEGTYEAIGMTSNGCVGRGEGSATIISSEVILAYKFGHPKCAETTDGFIELTLDENEGNYTYLWDNGADDKKLENLDEGEYGVIVSDEFGCTAAEKFSLTTPDPLSAKIEALGEVNCYTPNGGSIRLRVEGGTPIYNFAWDNGATMQNPSNLEGGTYKVQVTDLNGCETSAEVTIDADLETPNAKVQVDDILSCKNDELTLTANGTSLGLGLTFEWTTIDGNIIDYQTDLKPVVNAAGTYQLEVTNTFNGCSKTAEVFVKEDRTQPQIELEVPKEINCKESSQLLEGTITEEMVDYSLNWTTMDGNIVSDGDMLSPEVDAPGTYNVLVTNNINGCVIEKSVEVFENKVKPEVEIIDPEALTCSRKAVSIKTELTMGEKDYEFNWQTIEGNFLENRNTLTPSVDQPGVYTLVVTDVNNFCETKVQSRVMIDTLSPKVEAGQTAVFTCDRTVLNLDGSVLDNRAYDYEWTTENGSILDGDNSLNPTINQSGEYFLLVKDVLNGCEGMDMVLITDDVNRPNAVIQEPDAINCTNNSVVLDASNSTQGGRINYRWETFDGQILDATNPVNPVMGAPGTYLLFVVDQSNGCEGRGTAKIVLDTITPTALITSPEVFNCKSTEVQIDGSGSSRGANFEYDWQTVDGEITSKTDVISPMVGSGGTYEVTILNKDNGCTSTASLSIIEEKPTELNLDISQPLCFGDKGQANIMNVIGGVGPYSYSIDGGNRFHNEAGFSYLNPGYYNVVVKDINDCELEEVIQIVQPNELTVDLGAQVDIDLGDSTTLEAITNIPTNEVAEIIWSPAEGLSCDDCLNPTAKPFQSIDYSVEIVDQNGCEASSNVRFLVDQTPHIFVPNVVRPFDSQAGNDRFTIFAKQGMVNQIVTLEIYNRWGETVYQRKNFAANDPSMGWDGFFDRRRMKPAVFVYRAEIEMLDGRKVQLKGDFTLID